MLYCVGVYLPLLWESSFCWKTPIALGYTRGHFSALVPMEVDTDENIGAGANLDNNEDEQVGYHGDENNVGMVAKFKTNKQKKHILAIQYKQ